MAKIRSTKELKYDSRNGNTGIIQLEISNWSFNPEQSQYVAKVSDYLLTNEIDENEQVIEVRKLIGTKDVRYASAQIDGLFYLLQNPIELTESYTSEMDLLISQALLYVTQQDPIYGSEATDWQIV
jgi:hypothetical protein